jgi:hypothetical protein
MHLRILHNHWNAKFVSLFILGLFLGSAALLATYRYGLGVSTDAVDYMFTGLNVASGKGYITYNYRPYALWPPLYPTLLALIHDFMQQDMLRIATIVQVFTLIILAWGGQIYFFAYSLIAGCGRFWECC